MVLQGGAEKKEGGEGEAYNEGRNIMSEVERGI
jgi:hypothetical protein